MPIANSGAISLNTIQTEFGGSNPISINEYYAGGTYVPSGTSGVNGAVPTSGQISFSQFYGTSAVVVTLTSDSFSTTGVIGLDTAYIQWGLTGYQVYVDSNEIGFQTQYTWVTPTTEANNFYIKASNTSGTLTYGSSINTWIDTVNDPYWGITRELSGTRTVTMNVQISPNSNGTPVVASANITLSATMTN